MNKLVAEKVAIVSDKAGTTRDNIKGILNFQEKQYIFIDTPGIHKPKHLLGEYMTETAIRSFKDADVILFLLDGTQEISTGDFFIWEKIQKAQKPVVILVNKIDKISDQEIEEKKAEISEKLGDGLKVVFASGMYSFGLARILEALEEYLEEGIQYYPEDMYTDMTVYRMITEIVREKILEKTRDEIPHSVAIEILNVEERKEAKDKFDINIYVERVSQKGILIGKNGKMLKEIGSEARKEIESLLERKIYLTLWVKVKDDWRKKKPFLKELGYFYED